MLANLARLAALLLLFILVSASPTHQQAAAAGEKPGSAAPQAVTSPGDWPMYGHDPQHTGYNAAETTISADNVDQLVRRWRFKIGNSGTPSSGAPAVANGIVYVGSSAASGDNFFALDASSGGRVWSANLGFIGGCLPVGIGATAAISGSVVVAGGGDAAYYGLDALSGARLWRNTLGSDVAQYAWESPLLAYGRAYLGVSSRCSAPSARGAISAVDLFSGDPEATTYFVPEGQRGAGIWHSPALSPDGNTLVISTGDDYGNFDGGYARAMIALDAHTLQILGSHQEGPANEDADFATSPVVFTDSQGRRLTAAQHKNGFIYTYLLDNISAGAVWSRNLGISIGSMPAYDPTFGEGGTLFVTAKQLLYALDPATGADRWPPAPISETNSPMALANGLIFINSGGTLRIVDERTGQTLRQIAPTNAGCSYSAPSVANGFVYWLSGSFINAWSLPEAGATPTPTPSATPDPLNASPTPANTATPCPARFNDVNQSDYFAPSVQYLACAGVISGYADGTFRPYNDTTRGQITKMIVLAYGFPIIVPGEESFSDVPADNIYFPYVETVAARGIVSGYCDGSFRPWASVIRGQLAKIIVNAAGWHSETPTTPTFNDVGPGNPFYAEIETAHQHGLISGYDDGTFRWNARATRGQISKILVTALNTQEARASK